MCIRDRIIGFNDKYFFHHSINLDSNGLLYVGINDKNRTTRGNGFAILDQQLNILETHFIEDIYERNDMVPRLFSNNTRDPIHLNDVEPVNEKNKTKTENVLISLRSTSSVLSLDLEGDIYGIRCSTWWRARHPTGGMALSRQQRFGYKRGCADNRGDHALSG